jgi:hypothetical protein
MCVAQGALLHHGMAGVAARLWRPGCGGIISGQANAGAHDSGEMEAMRQKLIER